MTMTKKLFENEKAMLQFNEDTNAIELIWKKNQDPDTYRLMFTKGLNFLIEHIATGWVSDIRNESVVGPSSSKWVQTDIITKAVANGLKKIAVVMKADVFQEYYVKSIAKDLDHSENNLMQYFDSVDAANQWLKE